MKYLLMIVVVLIVISSTGCATKPKAETLLELDQFQNCQELNVKAKEKSVIINCKK